MPIFSIHERDPRVREDPRQSLSNNIEIWGQKGLFIQSLKRGPQSNTITFITPGQKILKQTLPFIIPDIIVSLGPAN